MLRSFFLLCFLMSCSGVLVGQGDVQEFLGRLEPAVSLTVNGVPFHAEMKLSGRDGEPAYNGSIVVDWAAPDRYRVEVRSPDFHDVRIVQGKTVQESYEGSFYPGWLHGFVTALMDPMFPKPLLVAQGIALTASQMNSGGSGQLCLRREDRPGGIRNDVTWGGLCVLQGGGITTAYTFALWMNYAEAHDFAGKKIASVYSTTVGSGEQLEGRLTSLRMLLPAEIEAIRAAEATPLDQQIGFTLVSTATAEARLESAKPFQWPAVREGKTDGYMIVHALTDVTGQVREAARYNSDNPGLQDAGQQAALGYKFKPMLVAGVPVEMEIPLVLHFTTRVEDALPVLRGAELLKQISGCDARLVSHPASGTKAVHVSINESGKLTGEGFGPQVDPGTPAVLIRIPPGLHALGLDCHFSPLLRAGVPTYYHGDLLVTRGH